MKNQFKVMVFLLAVTLGACSKEVEITSHDWIFEKGSCEASFTLKSNASTEIDRKIRITAYRQKNIGKGARVNDTIGEKEFIITLKPNEKREFKEKVVLKIRTRPYMVIVSQFEPN